MMMLMALCVPWAAHAQQELTVHEGTTTNNFVPVYGYYADAYLKCEMVYPADELVEMNGAEISGMTFYASQESVNWGTDFQVFLVEVADATISDFNGPGTVVYEGALAITGNQMTVEFNTPYTYGGGNLLVGIYQTSKGSYISSSWYGETVSDASVQGYSYSSLDAVSAAQRNFLPKTTFLYQGDGPVCDKPETFVVDNITAYGADFTWTSEVGNYTFEYKKASESDWTVVNQLTATTYSLNDLESNTAYNARVKAVCDAGLESGYKTVSFTTLEVCPDGKVCIGAGTTTNAVLPTSNYYKYSLTQQIFTAAELGEAGAILSVDFYKSGTNGSDARSLDIYMVSTDKETFSGTTDWITVTASDLVFSGDVTFADDDWTTIEFDNPFVYDGTNNVALIVDDNTGSYSNSPAFYVFSAASQAIQVRSDGTDYDPTAPTSYDGTVLNVKNRVRFAIGEPPACLKPSGLAVEYTGGTTATVTWTGDANSYNIDVNGTVTSGVASPYTLDRLELSTTYTVMVQADCGTNGTSDWTNPVSFTTDACMPEDQCQITITLTDAYGDGGGQITVVDADTEVVLGTYTNSGSSSTNTLNVCDGRQINFVYASTDNWSYENGWVITDVNGEVISEHEGCSSSGSCDAPTAGVIATYTVNCTETDCRKPSDFVASEIGKRSVVLSWTENGSATEWVIAYKTENADEFTYITVTDNPYTLTGLVPETQYVAEVTPVCDVEKPSDVITFTTDVACPAPNVTVTATPIAATVTWEGEASAYELEYALNTNPTFGFENFEDFEEGTLQGWTNIVVEEDGGAWIPSDENGGAYDYTGYAHNGTGFAMCYSFIDNDGAYTTDAYLVSPQMYEISAGNYMNFWYDFGNDSWPEHFDVCVATVDDPEASDFTTIWSSGSAKGGNGQKADVRHRNTRAGNWRNVTVDLSAYAGQSIWIAFHDVNEDMYEVWIDDVMIDLGQLDWTTVSATSPYTITSLDPDTDYIVRVRAICGGEDGESDWTIATFTTPSACDAPFDLNVTNLMPTSATLNWTGYQDGYEVWYRKAEGYEAVWEDDFENGLDDWTIVAGEGATHPSGGIWYTINPSSGLGFESHSGSYCASSWSWNSSAYTADNWLITPRLDLQGVLKYYVRTNAGYPDSYEVLLSTATNDTTNFTVTLKEMAAAPNNGEWNEVVIDLSDYAGRQGYIAIHHVDYDENYLVIDDIGIYNITEASEWTMVSTDETSFDISSLDPETTYEWQVRGVNRSCEDGLTDWSEMGTFTTPGLCDALAQLLIDELTATSITLSWTGYQERYNIQYRTAEVIEDYFYDDFSSGSLSNWTYDNLSSTNIYSVSSSGNIYGYVFWYDEDYPTQTLISNEMDAVAEGTELSFYYAPEGTSSFKVGYSSTDNDLSSFTWSDEVTVASSSYFAEYTEEVPEGTKYFAIQYTNGEEDGYLIVTYFDVVNVIAEAGDWVTIEGVTSPYTINGLTPETEYQVYVQGVCGEDETTEWLGGYFTTPELSTVEQTLELSVGWTWMSIYVESSDEVFEAIKDGIAENNSTAMIKAVDGSIMLQNGSWSAGIASLENETMYFTNMDNATTVTLNADPADPAAHPITLGTGWNWLGFISAEEMSCDEAMEGLTPNVGDMIKGAEGANSYSDNGWTGSLPSLEPGKGYMYYNAGDEMTLVYPSAAKGVVRSLPMEKYWSTNVHEHATNLVVMATLDESQFAMDEGNYEIGAFVNGECRGSSRLQRAGNGYVAFVVVHGDYNETISFKLYDVTNAKEAGSAEEQLRYVSNAIVGSVEEPMVLHFRGTMDVNEDANSLSVFPNPAKDKVMIQGQAIETVSVYNTLGQCLINETCGNATDVELNLSGLSAGVYTVSIRTNGMMINKLIVKE